MDEQPSTVGSPGGDPRVAEVLGELERLDGLEVEQHVAVFEATHARLRGLLTETGSAGA